MKPVISKHTMNLIFSAASSFTLQEVMILLDSLSSDYLTEIIYRHGRFSTSLFFNELALESHNLTMMCSQIGPIWFDGGPPNKKEWVCGMASQFVADCLFRALLKYGEKTVLIAVQHTITYRTP